MTSGWEMRGVDAIEEIYRMNYELDEGRRSEAQ